MGTRPKAGSGGYGTTSELFGNESAYSNLEDDTAAAVGVARSGYLLIFSVGFLLTLIDWFRGRKLFSFVPTSNSLV